MVQLQPAGTQRSLGICVRTTIELHAVAPILNTPSDPGSMVALPLPMIMSRRQNSSCDQCRKGKRACDAVWLRDRQLQRALDANELKGGPAALSSHEGTSEPAPPTDGEASGSARFIGVEEEEKSWRRSKEGGG